MTTGELSLAQVREAADFIAARISLRPKVGIVLGSGLAGLTDDVAQPVVLRYDTIPHFVPPTVEGHPGELFIGLLNGCPVIIMRGRVHFYEGHSIQQVTFPVRVMWALGVKYLIVTNAAGGLNPSFHAGDLMLITDHIGLTNMTGHNPLAGANNPEVGPRFPDMSQAYDPELRQLALQVAARIGLSLQQGVYVMSSGPSYETPAEVRFLRLMGADAVGMSTVPEATVASHAGIRVLGISGISNVAVTVPGAGKASHEEVLRAGQELVGKLRPLLTEIVSQMR